MRKIGWLVIGGMVAGFADSTVAQRMQKAEEPDEVGLVMVGKGLFPVPEGLSEVSLPNAGFETPLAADE
ncbi:MAG: hypothetical protein KDM64_15440, partial [Verrucomicrobiae bacterium]|nr:hypothetical protein [Verrucomicrobiae bacterium]